MAKDPALLWYFNDWHGGTATMSRFLKGCYMDLLHAQFNNGHLSLDEIKTVLGSDFGPSWSALQKKLKVDDKGFYYNPRLESERQNRSSWKQGRLNNLKGLKKEKILGYHMEDEDEIKIEIKNTNTEGVQGETVMEEFARFWKIYGKEVSRINCEKLWCKLSAEEKAEIFIHAPKYVESTPDKNFRKNPETYLFAQCWKDEIIIKSAPQVKAGYTTPVDQVYKKEVKESYEEKQARLHAKYLQAKAEQEARNKEFYKNIKNVPDAPLKSLGDRIRENLGRGK